MRIAGSQQMWRCVARCVARSRTVRCAGLCVWQRSVRGTFFHRSLNSKADDRREPIRFPQAVGLSALRSVSPDASVAGASAR